MNKDDADQSQSRYQRVREILDNAAHGSVADYQGYGRFWNLPIKTFLAVEIYGVRMIASAESGNETDDTRNEGASCCHSTDTTSEAGESTGRGSSSGLVQGLQGKYPFDDIVYPRLPWGGEYVSSGDIFFISNWIDDGCPIEDEPPVAPPVPVDKAGRQARAHGHQAHPLADQPINTDRARSGNVKVRKNVECLSKVELARLRHAFSVMRNLDAYELDERSLIFWSRIHASNCQHGWEEFLPWHRLYLYNFEQRLQDVDPTVTLPYWDWTCYYAQNSQVTKMDTGVIPDALHCWVSQAMLDELAGTISQDNHDRLREIIGKTYNSGARLYTDAGIVYGSLPADDAKIRAALLAVNPLWHHNRWPGGGSIGGGALLFEDYPAPRDIESVLSLDNFFTFGSGPGNNHFFGALENIHNLLHNFSGGQNPNFKAGMDSTNRQEPQSGDMVDAGVTAYDPIFWMHHSNVDRLWYEWQQRHPGKGPDNPTAVLPPFARNVEQSYDVHNFGYEYVKGVHHFPVDDTVPMTRFRSEKVSVPAHVVQAHQSAEIRVHGVRHMPSGGIVRAFLNAPDADVSTPTRGNDHYVGQFHTFGVTCVGGPGHCEPPIEPPRTFDQRPRHRKTPGTIRFDATAAIARLRGDGEANFHIHLVVLDFTGAAADDVLRMDAVTLNFFD